MSLPGPQSILDKGLVWRGKPFLRLSASPTIESELKSSGFTYEGSPFIPVLSSDVIVDVDAAAEIELEGIIIDRIVDSVDVDAAAELSFQNFITIDSVDADAAAEPELGEVRIPYVDTQSFSFGITVPVYSEHSSSFNVLIPKYDVKSASFAIGAFHVAVLPNTNSATDPGNVLLPAIISGGTVIASNGIYPAIDPTKTPYALGISLQNATSLNICDENQQIEVNLNRSGGTFEIVCKPEVAEPDRYSQITVLGLRGIVEDTFRTAGEKKLLYIRGFFGTQDKLNTSLMLLLQGGVLQSLAPSNPISSFEPNTWLTISAAAGAVAAAVGIVLDWHVDDLPLVDAFAETGTTALQAINNLAGRVGGIVVWNGNNDYAVVYPDFAMMPWTGYPSCSLISLVTRGKLGHSKSNVASLPINPQPRNQFGGFDSSVTFIDLYRLFNPEKPRIQQLWSGTQPLEPDETEYIDANGDFNNALHQVTPQTRMQIITEQTCDFCTQDPSLWGAQFVPTEYTDYGVLRFRIHSGLFPSGVDQGQFSIGYVPDQQSKNKALQQAIKDEDARQKLSLQSQYENIRWFDDQTIVIESLFFNSVPIPGQSIVNFEYDDIVFPFGVISDVSIKIGPRGTRSMRLNAEKKIKQDLSLPLNMVQQAH